MSPVNAALLGSGIFAATSYLPALVKISGLSVGTIWSRSESSATTLASKAAELGGLPNVSSLKILHGDNGFDSVLADKSIDAVILVLPIGVQPALIRRAWAAGKHVISEKPLGRDADEARALVDEYERDWKPKGLVWRVAENYAHEPILRYAGDLLRSPTVGDVLYWRLHSESVVLDGSAYQATTWRTVPDYQGGFILDGGVHWAALLRTVLPAPPAIIIAGSALHRTHLPPHDTVLALALPSPSATVEPHGPPTRLNAIRTNDDIPVALGKSAPQGTILLSWAAPDTPRDTRSLNELFIVTEHATLRIVNHGRAWTVTLTGAEGSGVDSVTKEAAVSGVQVELEHFGEAVTRAKASGKIDGENLGEPRNALWDLALIQATLTSDGKPLDISVIARGA